MGKQIIWVLATYFTNKLFLAVLAFACLFVAIIVGSSLSSRTRLESNTPPWPEGKLAVHSVESLETVRRGRLESQVDEIDLARLWWDMRAPHRTSTLKAPRIGEIWVSEVPFDVLKEFPNLRYVRMNVPEPARGIQLLTNPRGIRYLSAGTLQDLTPLASMHELGRLDVQLQQPVQGLAALASLPNLKMLVLSSDKAIDDSVPAEVARLPNLECLVIQSHDGEKSHLSSTVLARLSRAPKLRSLYIGPVSEPPSDDSLAQARAALPNVDVRPVVDVLRMPWFVGIAPTVLAIAVGGIVAMQFRNPASRLSPSFLRAHGLVGALWLAIVVAAALSCTWAQNQPLLTGLLFALGITGCMFGGGVDLVKQRQLGPTMKFSFFHRLLGLGILIIVPLIFLPTWWHIAGLSQSVQGRLALTNALVIAAVALVGAGFAWRAYVTLRDLSGATSAPGNESGRSTASFPANGALLDNSRYESLLEKWKSAPPDWTLWNRVLRWRVGNPRLRSLVLIVSGSVGMAIFVFFQLPAAELGSSTLSIGVYQIPFLFIACTLIAAMWRKRLTCLDVESLRPITRATLQRDWGASLACDLFAPALTVGVIATLAIYLRDNWFALAAWQTLLAAWPEVLAMFVLLTGVLWLATLALASLIIVIERQWLGFVIGFATFFVGSGAFGAWLGLSARETRGSLEPGVILPRLWLPAAVSATVIACMWRVWTRLDFDRRS